ncbi:uncharacterized protein N7496_007654 [Penicillium cataractarum]|uniref:FAD/NAD(P)-binding domain-containing protein n=1 Tax=Penicillium cataractarum TaxID=2100454 RepID=A0A9W9RZF9_9EURO|nr:uncharacterized protein N7496_007654 [Penicillium cataractarum]KAJ5367894.1 hypothetical protein N7496_007654 [Penicillium cataractarum]
MLYAGAETPTGPSAQMEKNVVILGGSYGGISTAHYLLKHVIPVLPDKNSYRVVLVSPSSQAMCRQACPRALLSDTMFPQEKLFVGISGLFNQYPKGCFRFIHGAATEFDPVNRNISIALKDGVSTTTRVDFYALVIATGASTPSPLLGLNQDEHALRQNWATFRAALPHAKSIIISGGGPSGVETAGELGEFLNGRAGWFNPIAPGPKVQIMLVTTGSRILPLLAASAVKKAEKMLADVGVTILKNTKITVVSPLGTGTDHVADKVTLTMESGETMNADLYIPATGTMPNTGFIPKDLLTADGRVKCSRGFRVDEAGSRVYAVGDVASSIKQPAVHVILKAIPILCANMKRDLLTDAGVSAAEDQLFVEDSHANQMVPIGRSKGVGTAMGYSLPSFLVWLVKGRDYWMWTTGSIWSGKHWS